MPKPPALIRFHKLVEDISNLYLSARKVQIQSPDNVALQKTGD